MVNQSFKNFSYVYFSTVYCSYLIMNRKKIANVKILNASKHKINIIKSCLDTVVSAVLYFNSAWTWFWKSRPGDGGYFICSLPWAIWSAFFFPLTDSIPSKISAWFTCSCPNSWITPTVFRELPMQQPRRNSSNLSFYLALHISVLWCIPPEKNMLYLQDKIDADKMQEIFFSFFFFFFP